MPPSNEFEGATRGYIGARPVLRAMQAYQIQKQDNLLSGGCYHPPIDLLDDNIQQEQKEPSVWSAFFVDKYGCFY